MSPSAASARSAQPKRASRAKTCSAISSAAPLICAARSDCSRISGETISSARSPDLRCLPQSIGEAQEEKNIPDDAGATFKAKRELVQLKQELQNAVKAEDYEKAIELRDKIRSMEQKG